MKKRFNLFLILLTFLLCACGQDAGSGVPSWQEQYDTGTQYLLEGNYEEAISTFTSAIEVAPERAEAYIGRGDAYAGLGDTDHNWVMALEDYETALALDDNNLSVYLKIADIHIARNEYEQLQEILNQAKEKYDDTEEIREREKVLHTYENYYNIGTKCLGNGDYEAAVSAFTTAIELDSGQADAYVGRGDAYTGLGDSDENLTFALADYEAALTLDDSNLSVYLKIADMHILKSDLALAQDIVERASEKFGDSEDVRARAQMIRSQKDAQLTELLVSNAWDTSWQTNEYHIFFPDLQGVRLVGGGAPGISYMQEEFSYDIENGTVSIIEDGYTSEWTFDESAGHFINLVEEYGDIYEQLIDPIPLQAFFTDMATISDSEVVSRSYWDDLLDLIILYKEKSFDENVTAALLKEQEDWQAELSQEISGNGIDTSTRSGTAWRNYYVKERIFELLELPFDNSNPPVYKPLLTADEAMQIALDFWNITPGEADPDTGFKMYVKLQDTVEKQGKTYYYFMLYWMVTASYNGYYDEHPSTLDRCFNAEYGYPCGADADARRVRADREIKQ